MNPLQEYRRLLTRRHFLATSGLSVGAAGLWSLLDEDGRAASAPHFPAKAKRGIYLVQSGAPSQLELVDYKPAPAEHRGMDFLWPGEREPRSADLRGHDLARHRPSERPAAVRPAVGERLSAVALSRREIPRRRRSGLVPVESAGRRQPGAPANAR